MCWDEWFAGENESLSRIGVLRDDTRTEMNY